LQKIIKHDNKLKLSLAALSSTAALQVNLEIIHYKTKTMAITGSFTGQTTHPSHFKAATETTSLLIDIITLILNRQEYDYIYENDPLLINN